MRKTMTAWELRGYLIYPSLHGKPYAGTREEMQWSIGWARAQREDLECAKSQYHLDLEFEAELGRNTYAASYRDEKNLQF